MSEDRARPDINPTLYEIVRGSQKAMLVRRLASLAKAIDDGEFEIRQIRATKGADVAKRISDLAKIISDAQKELVSIHRTFENSDGAQNDEQQKKDPNNPADEKTAKKPPRSDKAAGAVEKATFSGPSGLESGAISDQNPILALIRATRPTKAKEVTKAGEISFTVVKK